MRARWQAIVPKLSRYIQRWRPDLTNLTKETIRTILRGEILNFQCHLKREKEVEVEVVNKIKEKEEKASSIKRNLWKPFNVYKSKE